MFYIDCYNFASSVDFPVVSYGPHSSKEVLRVIENIIANKNAGIDEMRVGSETKGSNPVRDKLENK